jgi:hypothetical protein
MEPIFLKQFINHDIKNILLKPTNHVVLCQLDYVIHSL